MCSELWLTPPPSETQQGTPGLAQGRRTALFPDGEQCLSSQGTPWLCTLPSSQPVFRVDLLSLTFIKYLVKFAGKKGSTTLKRSSFHLLPEPLSAGVRPAEHCARPPPGPGAPSRRGRPATAQATWHRAATAPQQATHSTAQPAPTPGRPGDCHHLGAGVPGRRSYTCWGAAQSPETGCSDGFSSYRIQPED